METISYGNQTFLAILTGLAGTSILGLLAFAISELFAKN